MNYQDFSVTKILREINFEESISSKTAVFATLGALVFDKFGQFSLQKAEKLHKNQNSEPLKVKKWQILHF